MDNEIKNMVLRSMASKPLDEVKPTHYSTRGNNLTQYLFLNDEWFIKTWGWTRLSFTPVDATPIGKDEPQRPQAEEIKLKKEQVKALPAQKEFNPYRGMGKHKGD